MYVVENDFGAEDKLFSEVLSPIENKHK